MHRLVLAAAVAACARGAPGLVASRAAASRSAVAKAGVYDYMTQESSPVVFNGRLLMLESIPREYANRDPRLAACDNYMRVRDMETLGVVVSLLASCNHSFGAAFVYANADGADTFVVSATPWDRHGAWSGPCSGGASCSVDLLWSSSPTLEESSWTARVPGIPFPGFGIYNQDIMPVPASAALPFRWAMAIETTQEKARFAVSASADPTNTSAWALLNASFTVPPWPDTGSCPSLRHDGEFFYYLTGGKNIHIMRSPDLLGWQESATDVLVFSDPGDCIVAPSWFGPYVPTGEALQRLQTCGPAGTFGDDSDVDLVEWTRPFGSNGPPIVLLEYGSGDQRTFGFSNLAIFNGTMIEFLRSFF